MVRKSYGKMRGTRSLKASKLPISRFLKEFRIGDTVSIDINPSSRFSDPKFHGKTGKIIDKKGNGYLISVKNKKALKKIFMKSEHLKKGY